MNDFLAVSALSMQTDMNRVNAIAHNIANTSTVGFKRIFSFYDNQNEKINVVDIKQGALSFSASEFDIAIEGERYFLTARDSSGQTLLTRGGSLMLDNRSRLILAQSGLPLLNDNGQEIFLNNPEFKVTAQGEVIQQGEVVSKLRVKYLTENSSLEAQGNGLYRPLGPLLDSSDSLATMRLKQGFIERSNVNSSAQMVELTQTLRHFESVQKSVQAMDSIWEKAIRTLGEL